METASKATLEKKDYFFPSFPEMNNPAKAVHLYVQV
jgi:hypothetical protein